MPTIRFTAGNQAMETAIDQQLGLDFMDTVLILCTLSWPSMLIRPAAREQKSLARLPVANVPQPAQKLKPTRFTSPLLPIPLNTGLTLAMACAML